MVWWTGELVTAGGGPGGANTQGLTLVHLSAISLSRVVGSVGVVSVDLSDDKTAQVELKSVSRRKVWGERGTPQEKRVGALGPRHFVSVRKMQSLIG